MVMLHVLVPGRPVAQGSKRHVGNGVMVESNAKRLFAWRDSANAAISLVLPSDWPEVYYRPMTVEVSFYFKRPKSHYRSGQYGELLKKSTGLEMVTRPDIDKLTRAVLDACTLANVWNDDSQVVTLHAYKLYQRHEGTKISVWPIPEEIDG